ncbi:hypothetical protein MBOE_35350 [Mycolicibacterium boenickei]|uniref:Uncharacterized protein n=1 Tax=Mycolicibacterium boenickei TaxID=146017 RepID=A0ABN5ZFN4_9MYCO|nr:hypothetical protein MBOE_35350 [Mycolicibacterium boenickei]
MVVVVVASAFSVTGPHAVAARPIARAPIRQVAVFFVIGLPVRLAARYQCEQMRLHDIDATNTRWFLSQTHIVPFAATAGSASPAICLIAVTLVCPAGERGTFSQLPPGKDQATP